MTEQKLFKRYIGKIFTVAAIVMFLLLGVSVSGMAGEVPGVNAPPQGTQLLNVTSIDLVSVSSMFCTDDVGGPNDQPGQKDLTQMCVDSSGDPFLISFNWDEILGGGANTYDACSMFDTDSDGNINYSLCVSVQANSGTDIMEYFATTLYSCGDDKPDRCTQPVNIITPSPGTVCSTSQQDLDPFPAGAAYPQDTVGECDIVLSDVGGAGAVFVNVCSFPSQQPNSDPSDCITEPGSGFITIEKIALPDDDTVPFEFPINDGETDVYSPIIYGSGFSDRYSIIEGIYSVSELIPDGWILDSAICVEQFRGEVGTPDEPLTGVYGIELQPSDDILCTFEDSIIVESDISTTPDPSAGIVGVRLHDTALVEGEYDPTGTVTFYLFEPGDTSCSSPVHSEIVALVDGSASTVDGYLSDVTGTWRWTAEYSGDSFHYPSSSGCNDEQVIIGPELPAITTVPDPDNGIVGIHLDDTAELMDGYNPTGSINFKLYDPTDLECEGDPVHEETVPVSGNGSYRTSTGFDSNLAGIWNWTAEYSGDINNSSVGHDCGLEQVTVRKDSPDINTTPEPESGLAGEILHDSAVVIDGFNPTGTVTFNLYEPGDETCESAVHTETVDLVEDEASTVDGYISNMVGTWRWKAIYSGDVNNNGDESGCDDEMVLIDPVYVYLPLINYHLVPVCELFAKQINPSSYTVKANLVWKNAASPEEAPAYHRIKWGDNSHTGFWGSSGEQTFYHTYGAPGWYEVLVMLWGRDGVKYFPCGQWVDPPPQYVINWMREHNQEP